MKKPNFFNYYLFPVALLLFTSCSEDDPGTSNIIQTVSSIEVFDIDNFGDSRDIRVFLEKSNNSELSDFQVIIAKADNEITLEQSSELNAGRVYSINDKLKFNIQDNIFDADGDTIFENTDYQIYILDISAEPVLNGPSPVFRLTNEVLQDIYISSRGSNSVELFDGVTGEHIRSFIPPRSKGLGRPQEVIFLSEDELLVTGRDNSALFLFDGKTGEFIKEFTSGYTLDNPTKTSLGPDGNIYVSQWGADQNAIARFDGSTGAFIDEVIGSFFQGMGHTWDNDGNFYTVSFGLSELRIYDSNYNLVKSVKSNLVGPVNIWVKGESLFIADWQEGKVKEFTKNGDYKGEFINSGLSRVEGFLMRKNELLLCDWLSNVVNIYDGQTGESRKKFIDSDIDNPNSITLGPNKRPK